MKLARVEQPVTEREQNPFVPFEFVGADYFRTLAIPILRGRGFTDSDTLGSERVVVVNETLAKQLWPNQDALGKRLVQVTGPTGDTAFTVVGIASDTRFRELRSVGPVAYFASDQVDTGLPRPPRRAHHAPAGGHAPRAARRVAGHQSGASSCGRRRRWISCSTHRSPSRDSARCCLAGFSLVALLLSAIGLYGVMASGVRRQTRDIGVAHGTRSGAGHNPPARPRAGLRLGRESA